jgi:hypothetical protein
VKLLLEAETEQRSNRVAVEAEAEVEPEVERSEMLRTLRKSRK